MGQKILFHLFIIIIFNCEKIYSQTTCAGSLGDPIINITFGQGLNPGAPFSISVPGANTSYVYTAPTGNTASNTIFDGQYSLVNSVPSNPSWLTGGDHTNNGSGYMAFFNAAPTPGDFYNQTVTGLCAGTTYEFSAWLLNAINSNLLPNAVPPNVTFKIFNPGNLITPLVTFSTGDIPGLPSILWKRYSTLFTTPSGINSVILVLSNNNVGGTNFVGNDMAIDDIAFRACGPLTVASFSGTSILNSLSICNNIPYTLYGVVSAGLNNPVYQWQMSDNNGLIWTNIPNANSLIFTLPGGIAGLYKFRLESQEIGNSGSAFCKFYSTPINLAVTVCTPCSSFAADAGVDTSFCSNISVRKQLKATGGSVYSWSNGTLLDNSLSASPIATVNNTTKFYVTISDGGGCSGTDSVTIYVYPKPNISIEKSNNTNCIYPSSQLKATGAISYSWLPTTTLNNATIYNPLAFPLITTQYFVTGTDNNGCVDSSSIIITKDNSLGFIELPNTFTPNNDNKNDCFRVLFNGEMKSFSLLIFNRLGEKVFESHDSKECWNGKFKNTDVVGGNYIYYINAKTFCGEYSRKGNLLLIR